MGEWLGARLGEPAFEYAHEHERFVRACATLGLPFNASKWLVRDLASQLLGRDWWHSAVERDKGLGGDAGWRRNPGGVPGTPVVLRRLARSNLKRDHLQ